MHGSQCIGGAVNLLEDHKGLTLHLYVSRNQDVQNLSKLGKDCIKRLLKLCSYEKESKKENVSWHLKILCCVCGSSGRLENDRKLLTIFLDFLIQVVDVYCVIGSYFRSGHLLTLLARGMSGDNLETFLLKTNRNPAVTNYCPTKPRHMRRDYISLGANWKLSASVHYPEHYIDLELENSS